jgi:transcriptional regulator with XRE-family HTH domain
MPTRTPASEIKTHAGRRLACVRRLGGLDTERFANLIQVEIPTLRSWERGDRLPDPLAMVRMLEATGIGLDWIYAGSRQGLEYTTANRLAALAHEAHAHVADGAIVAPTPEIPEEPTARFSAEPSRRRAFAEPQAPFLHEKPPKVT